MTVVPVSASVDSDGPSASADLMGGDVVLFRSIVVETADDATITACTVVLVDVIGSLVLDTTWVADDVGA